MFMWDYDGDDDDDDDGDKIKQQMCEHKCQLPYFKNQMS